MFKFISLSLLVGLFGATLSFNIGLPAHLQPRILEDLINKSVECVRTTLDSGLPDVGLPSFNPLIIDNYTLNWDELNITDDISGFFTLDGRAENIVDFIVTDIVGTLDLVPPTYTVNFTLRNGHLNNTGTYKTNMTLLGASIWGEGDIAVIIEGLTLSGHVKAVIENFQVSLKELAAPATLEKLTFKITGLYDDEEFSKEISEQLSALIPEIINNNPDLFIEIIGPVLVRLFNALVNDEIGQGILKYMVKTCIIDVLFPPF